MSLLNSILHNIGVVLVGLAIAWAGTLLDGFVGLPRFPSRLAAAAGSLLLLLGFLLRVWATYHFYERRMSVIRLEPQGSLITAGPFRYSRNPLYLGGNVFIFFGAALLLGSTAAVIVTAAHLPLIDLFIRREERQLARQFGRDWEAYKARVRRWI